VLYDLQCRRTAVHELYDRQSGEVSDPVLAFPSLVFPSLVFQMFVLRWNRYRPGTVGNYHCISVTYI